MIFETRPPCAPLRAWIDSYAFYSGYRPAHGMELLLPDGGVDLIIDLTEEPKRIFDQRSFSLKSEFRRGWVSGMRMERLAIQASRGEPMIVVRFKPSGAWPFFDFPMAALTDRVTPLEDVWGGRFHELRDRLLAAASRPARFDVLDRHFMDVGRDGVVVNDYVAHAVAVIEGMTEPPGMKRLAADLGFSQKHVAAMFHKHVGVSPKRYARIVRFQRMLRRLEDGAPRSWADFALGFGFYDQAHLIYEFKAFAGMTPTHYLKSRGDFLNYLPVSGQSSPSR